MLAEEDDRRSVAELDEADQVQRHARLDLPIGRKGRTRLRSWVDRASNQERQSQQYRHRSEYKRTCHSPPNRAVDSAQHPHAGEEQRGETDVQEDGDTGVEGRVGVLSVGLGVELDAEAGDADAGEEGEPDVGGIVAGALGVGDFEGCEERGDVEGEGCCCNDCAVCEHPSHVEVVAG